MPYGDFGFFANDLTNAEMAYFLYWGLPVEGSSPLEDSAISIAGTWHPNFFSSARSEIYSNELEFLNS